MHTRAAELAVAGRAATKRLSGGRHEAMYTGDRSATV